jgi:hypothetical protein
MALKDLSPLARTATVGPLLVIEFTSGPYVANYAPYLAVNGVAGTSNDAELARLLNTTDPADTLAVRGRPVTALEILTAMDASETLTAVPAAHLQALLIVASANPIDPTTPGLTQFLNRIWSAAAGPTRTNLTNLVKRKRTRAEIVTGEDGFVALPEDVTLALRPPAGG